MTCGATLPYMYVDNMDVLADFTTPLFKPPQFGPEMDFLDIFSAQNNCLVIGYLMGT